MSEERLLYALSQVDGQFITESAPGQIPPKKIPRIKWASLAACFCILLLVLIHPFQQVQDSSPPYLLPVETIADLEYLLNSPSLSDDELKDYLSEHGYNFMNVYDREDLNRILSPFQEVGCPVPKDPENVTSFSVQCGVRYGYIFAYSIGGVLYVFDYELCETKPLRPFMIPAKTVDIDGRSVNLRWGYKCLVGELYSGDHQVRIIARSFSDIDDVNFDHFRWQYPADSETSD